MLKTNSKKARENIRTYILNNIDLDDLRMQLVVEALRKNKALDVYKSSLPRVDVFSIAAQEIDNAFFLEKLHFNKDYEAGRVNRAALFRDWCAGLPGILDTCYFYNRSALKDVQNILEQTDSEAARYTETQAENLLTSMIYREIWEVVAA